MRVLIVEDETAAYENLADTLHAIDPAIEIAGNTESVGQTEAWLRNNSQPDLIFMDIHLSDGSAFALFERMRVETPIIFTTAYDNMPSRHSASTASTTCSSLSNPKSCGGRWRSSATGCRRTWSVI